MKKSAVFLVRIAVVIVIYALILRRISLHDISPLLTSGFYVALAGAVLLNLAQAVVCTRRWMKLAENTANVPGFLRCYAAYLEGLFFNQALPSFVGGDAVRVMRWRSFGVTTRDAILSVLQDRLLGAIGAAVMAFVACILLMDSPLDRGSLLAASMLAAAAFFGGVGALALVHSTRLTGLLSRFPRIYAILDRHRAPRLNAMLWAWLTANAVFGQVLSGLSVYILASALGIDLPPLLLISIAGIVLVVTMIPISLAGWGVREASFLVLLVPLGIDRERALMLSLGFGLSCLLSALLGGISVALGLATSIYAPIDSSNA